MKRKIALALICGLITFPEHVKASAFETTSYKSGKATLPNLFPIPLDNSAPFGVRIFTSQSPSIKGNLSKFWDADEIIVFTDIYTNQIYHSKLGDEPIVLAGSGSMGWADGPLMSAMFDGPSNVAMHPIDTEILFVTDFYNHVIRKIDLKLNFVSTICGSPKIYGFRNGDCKTAQFFTPVDIVVDRDGSTLYIADSGNHLIRKVKGGTVSTAVGTGKYQYNGLEGSATSINLNTPFGLIYSDYEENILYVNDKSNLAIRKVNLTQSKLTTVFFDPVRRPVTWGIAQRKEDWDQYIYTADFNSHCIRRINLINGTFSTFAASCGNPGLYDGTKFLAQLTNPMYISFSSNGDLHIADAGNSAIRVLRNFSNYLDTMIVSVGVGFEDGEPYNVKFRYPHSVEAYSPGNDSEFHYVIVSDTMNNSIRKIRVRNSDGLATDIKTLSGKEWSGFEDGPIGDAVFSQPYLTKACPKSKTTGLEHESCKGLILVADANNNGLRLINTSSGIVSTITKESATNNQIRFPNSILWFPERSTIYASSYSLYAITRILYDPQTYNTIEVQIVAGGKRGCVDGEGLAATFTLINGLESSKDEKRIYVTDSGCRKIRIIDIDSGYTVSTLSGDISDDLFLDGEASKARYHAPFGLSNIEDSSLFISDEYNHAIRRLKPISKAGIVDTIVGRGVCGYRNGPLQKALLCTPKGISALNETLVYVTNTQDHAIQVINLQTNMLSTVAGPGSPVYRQVGDQVSEFGDIRGISGMFEVEQDTLNTTLFVVDSGYSSIIRVVLNSNSQDLLEISSLVGDGSYGWMDGIGTNCQFNKPQDIVTLHNVIFVADTGNHLIRKIQLPKGIVTTFAGNGEPGLLYGGSLLTSSFKRPSGITIDPKTQDIYVSDTGNNCIRRIRNESITIIAGSATGFSGKLDGVGSASLFSVPLGLEWYNSDSQEDPSVLFVADSANKVIRVISFSTTNAVVRVKSISCGSGPYDGPFKMPSYLTMDRENRRLFVSDGGNHVVRYIDMQGFSLSNFANFGKNNFNFSCFLVSGSRRGWLDGAVDRARHNKPMGVYWNSKSNYLVVADARNKMLRLVRENVSPFKTTMPGSQENVSVYQGWIVGVILGLTACFAGVFLIYNSRKSRQDIVAKLGMIGVKAKNVNGEITFSKTLNLDGTQIAIAIPGFLRVNLKKVVHFDHQNDPWQKVGGTASVVKAKLKDPKLVAKHYLVDVVVKFMSPDRVAFDSFMYELAVMAALPVHKNLVKLIGYSHDGEGKDVYAIIMKDYPLNLRDLIEEKALPAKLSVDLKIATDIAEGMQIIHKYGVLHFDLKPANILVEFLSPITDSTSDNFNCVICDFGFANFQNDAKDKIVKGLKRPTAVGITARYAAPELFQLVAEAAVSTPVLAMSDGSSGKGEDSRNPGSSTGRTDLNERKIDVFAYGMTAFYVHTRVLPWNNMTILDIERSVCVGLRPTFPVVGPGVDGLRDLISRCWDHVPRKRPEFSEILETLKTFPPS